MTKRHQFVIGQRFGRLTIVKEVSKEGGKRRVVCRCDCAKMKVFQVGNVCRGRSASCGCMRDEETARRNTKHGYNRRGERTQAYRAWCGLRDRCSNPDNKCWHLYGGRGIKFDPAWADFSKFLEDVGEPPSSKHQLDRWPDMNGDYKPGNVRWATAKEQARNTRKNVFVEFTGIRLTIAEWAEKLQIDYHALYYRLSKGWSVEKAFTLPSARGAGRG